jgi:hypothetical protein
MLLEREISFRKLGSASEWIKLHEQAMESTMIDTGHVGVASNDMADVTQRLAAIVTNAQAARHFLDHRPPDLDEIRQALDCIVRDAHLASDVIYLIRGFLSESLPSSNSVVD